MTIEGVFGIVLRECRKKRRISQEELAHRSGLDRTFISLMERGKRKPTLNTIFALSGGLEVKPSFLVQEVEFKIHTRV